MDKYSTEMRRVLVVRNIHRLLLDLEDLEEESQEYPVKSEREQVLDFYIPKGLRDIHKLPLRRL